MFKTSYHEAGSESLIEYESGTRTVLNDDEMLWCADSPKECPPWQARVGKKPFTWKGFFFFQS